MKLKLPNYVHFVGICGSATSAIAVMFKNAGVEVTGSDKGFFPPVSDYLEANGIEIGIGYKKSRLLSDRKPDFIVTQGVKPNNEEVLEAKKQGISIKTFPEILKEYVITEDSIVVAGTFGKTSITAMLTKIFSIAGVETSFMYGGVSINFETNAKIRTNATKYSIVEGDEYMTSLENKASKFFYYSPKYLVLNSCSWEHTDLFETENDYVVNFQKLVATMPSDGLIVANANDANVMKVVENSKIKCITYSIDRNLAKVNPDWFLDKTTKPLPTFIKWDKKTGNIEVIPYTHNLIGEFNEENFLAAAALSSEIGLKKEQIQDGIEQFKGIKRRLEKIYENDQVILLDDFGSSPPKAKGSLTALRSDYPESKITLIFEPNTGNRTQQSVEVYKDCFDLADEITFPRFTKLPRNSVKRMNERQLANALNKYYPEIKVIEDDQEVIKFITTNEVEQHRIIVFMGSHGFRGMIENAKITLESKFNK